MKERPILFSGEMVRAILDGRKTQTRRVVKPQPVMHDFGVGGIRPALTGVHVINGMIAVGCDVAKDSMGYVRCPYGQSGDRLWVKETIVRGDSFLVTDGGTTERRDSAVFAADGAPTKLDAWVWQRDVLSSIHCPRGLSRITLEVTGVRVERLQRISEEDARAEGITHAPQMDMGSAVPSFEGLWESINAKRAPWASNPWVWVVEFKAHR